MLVKIVGADGKACSMYDYVSSYIFHEREDAPGWWVTITLAGGVISHRLVEGPVYVMNDRGDTIDKFTKR